MVAKAWELIDRFVAVSCRPLQNVLVTGAGPVGLLAALLGAQRGLRLHVLDRATEGPKRRLAEALGAQYFAGSVQEACAGAEPEIVLECTGAPEVVVGAVQHAGPGAIVSLLGVSPRGRSINVDVGSLNDALVLENDVVFGSVSANHHNFQVGAAALARADPNWLEALITRRVPLDRFGEALERRVGDIKPVIEF